MWNNQFTASALDNIVNKLDSYGVTNGDLYLRVASQPMSALTPASATSFQNLINKGWRIDIPQINITGQGNSIPGDGSNTTKSK